MNYLSKGVKLCKMCAKPGYERTFRLRHLGKTDEFKHILCDQHAQEITDKVAEVTGVKPRIEAGEV